MSLNQGGTMPKKATAAALAPYSKVNIRLVANECRAGRYSVSRSHSTVWLSQAVLWLSSRQSVAPLGAPHSSPASLLLRGSWPLKADLSIGSTGRAGAPPVPRIRAK